MVSSASGSGNAYAPITFGGLASGLDTNSIIDSLIAIQRRPISLAAARSATIQTRQAALQQVNGSLKTLFSKMQVLAKSTTYTARAATVLADSANTGKLSATATTSAAPGSFRVDILGLATATKTTGTNAVGQVIDQNAAMDVAGFRTAVTAGSFSINGTTFTIAAATASTIESAAAIGAAVDSGVALDAAGLDLAPVSGTFTINGTDIVFDAAVDSLNTIVTRINGSAADVTATYDATSRKLTITNNTAGNSPTTLVDTSGNFLEAMNLIDNVGAKIGAETVGTDMISLSNLMGQINGAGIGVTASIVVDGAGRLNLLELDGGATPVQLGSGGDTSNFLAATNVLASPSGTVRTSTSGLGGVSLTADLVDVRLDTPLSQPAGTFTINGVQFTYDETQDSLTNVISRINSSAANVVASYDSQTDKLVLTSSKTGSTAVSMSDDTGNFLAATSVLGATQTLGQNASYTIDGGAVQYSTTNVVSTAVSGVTLTLNDVTTASVTVDVASSPQGAVDAMQAFVTAYNDTMSVIRDSTKYSENGQNGLLFGDSTLRMTEQRLHSLVISPVLGATGTLRSLADVGLSFGVTGSVVGTTKELVFDSGKFTTALQSDTTGVVNLLTGFQGTVALQAGGTGSLASVSGTPSKATKPGAYSVASTATGSLTVTFTPDDGSTSIVSTGTISAGGTNTTLIPGVTLTANGALTAGTDTVTLTATQHGVGLTLQAYTESLTRFGGVYDGRNSEIQSTLDSIGSRIDAMEARLQRQQQALIRKYSQLEVTISRLQNQQQALSGMMSQLQGLRP